MALGDLMTSRSSQSLATVVVEDLANHEDEDAINNRDSATADSSYVADNATTTMTTSMAYLPQNILFCELRHDRFEEYVPSGPSRTGLISKWRIKNRGVELQGGYPS